MTKVNESFSAFLDDEATELDIQRMLNAMEDEPSVINHWHDLSATQAVIQDMPVLAKAATLTISPEQSTEVTQPKSWYRRLMQGGIAAAVAVLTVMSAQFMAISEKQTTDSSMPTVAVKSQSLEKVQLLTQQQYEAQQQLDIFLREHAEQAAFTTGHVVTRSQLQWVEPE